MKFKFLSLFLVLALALGMGFVTPVQAVGYGTTFATSVTYMNVGTATAVISVDFYSAEATSVTQTYSVADLAPNSAASLGIGAVFTSAFQGSAVMSSSQPLVATMVQVPSGTTTVKNRPLSNGFSSGSTSVLIPTVLKGVFNTNSIFSIQNAGTAAANVDVHFTPATAGTATTFTVTNLNPGAAKYFDMGTFTQAGATFNGSVTVTSAQPMVASSMELSTVGDAVYAFEGTSGGASTLYMPSAMCNFGPTKATSFFAIQNTSATSATVSVTYKGAASGAPVNVTVDLGTLAGGAKVSAGGCGSTTSVVPQTFLGSAVVTASQPVVAIAKISGAGAFVAAHSGVTGGSAKLAAPYVRYSDKFYAYTNAPAIQQSNIAIQNVGTTDIAANQITVTFINTDGSSTTYTYASTLAAGAKFSVNPKVAGVTEFGYTPDPTTGKPTKYGGGAIISGPTGSQLAAVIRITSSTAAGDVAEDYNALPAQ